MKYYEAIKSNKLDGYTVKWMDHKHSKLYEKNKSD